MTPRLKSLRVGFWGTGCMQDNLEPSRFLAAIPTVKVLDGTGRED